MKNFDELAFVDIETTGLEVNKHEIIEIAIITKSKHYHVKVSPNFIEFADPKALEINGYRPEEWLESIPSHVVAREIADILHNKIIVGHNPKFDMGFIREMWDTHNCTPYVSSRYIDTIQLAREHLPYCPQYRLDTIRRYLGWSLVGAHSAMVDCEDTKKLFHLLWRCSSMRRAWLRFRYRLICWLSK